MIPWHHDPPPPRGTGTLFSAPGVLVSLTEHDSKAFSPACLAARLANPSVWWNTRLTYATPRLAKPPNHWAHACTPRSKHAVLFRAERGGQTWLEAIWFQAHAGEARARTGVTKTCASCVTCVHLAPVRCTLTLSPSAGRACVLSWVAQASRWVRCDTAARRRRVTMAELGRKCPSVSDRLAGVPLRWLVSPCLASGWYSPRLHPLPVMCPICSYPAVASLSLRQQTPSAGTTGRGGLGR